MICAHCSLEHANGTVDCAAGHYGGRPHVTTCALACPHNTARGDWPILPAQNPPPKQRTAEQVALARRRAATCGGCPQKRSDPREINFGGVLHLLVGCRACGCAGLSLFEGACPLDKWR